MGKMTTEEKSAKRKEFYVKNRDRLRAQGNAYYHKRKMHFAAMNKQWREDNPEKTKSTKLMEKFGIDFLQYNKILAEQNGCCAICGRHKSEFKRALAVDHNHDTKEIRGLLCHTCNNGIGCFKSDQGLELLCSAISYMKNNDKIWRTA